MRMKMRMRERDGMVSRQDVFFTCSHQMHMGNYSNSRDCGKPSSLYSRRQLAVVYTVFLPVVHLMKTQTFSVQWGYFTNETFSTQR